MRDQDRGRVPLHFDEDSIGSKSSSSIINELITIDRFHDFLSPTLRWNNKKIQKPVNIFQMIKIPVKIYQSCLFYQYSWRL